MTVALWEQFKSAYLEALSLPENDRQGFVSALEQRDSTLGEWLRTSLVDSSSLDLDLHQPCWAASPPSSPLPDLLTAGHCLAGRFEITHCLGRGGAGEVYRAFDREQRDFVAVKLLRPELAPNRQARAMLRNELHTARLVSHDNVCRLHEFYENEAEGRPFLTMELVIGETLQDRLRKTGRFPEAEAAPLVQQILDGLDAIHRMSILHRDLKPSNIMINGDNRVLLMDFGLARDIQVGRDIEQTLSLNRFAGTVAYVAPEQLRGEAATRLSDIHALGVVLFEMLTGHRPFDGATPLETASKRLQGKAPVPTWQGRPVQARWAFLIASCLEQDPNRRPQSITEIRKLLAAGPPFFHQRRAWIMASLAGALGLGAVAGLFPLPRLPKQASRDIALRPYLRGSKLLEEFSLPAAQSAVGHFQEALALDPAFDLAMVGLTEAHLYLSKTESVRAAHHLAEAAKWASQAVRTNSLSALSHLAEATVAQATWDWPKADAAYRRALALSPEIPKAHRWYGGFLLQFGKFEEGLKHAYRAWELDPEDRSLPGTIGFYHLVAGRFREALQYLEPAVAELDSVSRSDSTRFNLAQVYSCLGAQSQGEESKYFFAKALDQAALIRKFEDRSGSTRHVLSTQLFAHIHALKGDPQAAKPHLQALEQHYAEGLAPALYLGVVYAALGQTHAAVAVFQKGLEKRDPTMLYINVIPFLANLRSEPSFQAIIRQMAL